MTGKEASDRTLNGRIAFITGAYRNLGAVIAEAIAEKGASLVLNDLPEVLSSEKKEKLVYSLRERYGVNVLAIDGDVRSYDSLCALRDQICSEMVLPDGRAGIVSILVNCAGPFNMDPFLVLNESDWDTVMDVNLKAVYLTARCFAPAMKTEGWGRIVNLSAGSSFVRNHGVYGLAKAGVSFLTEELAAELGPEVTVNAVAPGQIAESLPLIHEIDPTFGERYTARTPLQRLVTRRDVADLIVMLCSPVGEMITGETLRLDGGAELPRFL